MDVTQETLEALAQDLGAVLMRKGWMLACAESCTGGWAAQACTAIAGSSAWFERGFVTYSNAAKQELLAVRDETLSAHGAVSEAVAREMALGVLAHSPARAAFAITGIAGPSGGTADKPVGTVWFAWALASPPAGGGVICAEKHLFSGDRRAIRAQAVAYALGGMHRYISAGGC